MTSSATSQCCEVNFFNIYPRHYSLKTSVFLSFCLKCFSLQKHMSIRKFLCPQYSYQSYFSLCCYSELLKKTGFFKEQNKGFSAQIYRVTLPKTFFFFKGMLAKISHKEYKSKIRNFS